MSIKINKKSLAVITTALTLTISATPVKAEGFYKEHINNPEYKDNYEEYFQKSYIGINNIKYLEQSYPDIIFEKHFDKDKNDWLVTITVPDVPGTKNEKGKKYNLYWANGSLLPEEELGNKEKYWSLFTYYADTLRNPDTYTEKEIQEIRKYGSDENRENSRGTPMFFFEAVYDTETRKSTEEHIKEIPIFDKTTKIHERLEIPLKNVERKIKDVAKTDKTVEAFLKSLNTYDSYVWREIRGTGRKSFHSLGVAIDIMPKYLAGKQIFWSWAKDLYEEKWMEIPLSQRWIPPKIIIDIFESEGFIWGGKWVIYDNMHFEYHPELILYNRDN